MKLMLASLALAVTLAGPAAAHRLVIYAYAEAGEIVVEAKFTSGNPARLGEIEVLDAASNSLLTLPLEEDGETRFAIPEGAAEGGVNVEVRTDEGHEDYWILSPADLEAAK